MTAPLGVELAGGTMLGDASREAVLRRAPDWWRRLASRGLDTADVADQVRPARRKFSGVLCGVAAPGVSVPVRCALDDREIRETIDPAAWPEALDAITKERPVRLDSRHYGGQFASTADGTLRLSCNPILGLLLEADMPDEPLARVLITNAGRRGVGLSIGFKTTKVEHRKIDGETVRLVRKLRLDHVALVAPGQRPAYPGAVAYFAQHGDRQAIEAALGNARVDAWRHVRPWRLKIA